MLRAPELNIGSVQPGLCISGLAALFGESRLGAQDTGLQRQSFGQRHSMRLLIAERLDRGQRRRVPIESKEDVVKKEEGK